MNKAECTPPAPELSSEFEAIKEQTKRTNELAVNIANKITSLKQFNPFEPTDELKHENDFVGALRNERYSLRNTNDLLQRCLNHLNELF